MKVKNLLGLVLSICSFAVSNSNANEIATVMLNLRPDKFDVMLNGELETVDYSLESLNTINDFIGNYFKIDSICYNNDHTVATVNCLQVENNIPCKLTIKNAFTNNEQLTNLRFMVNYNSFFLY